jgi:curved DNA-binding protein CbpA
MNDHYTTLGIRPGATMDEIKTAFRKLAQIYHPDKPNGNAEKFKKINHAYQELSKPGGPQEPFVRYSYTPKAENWWGSSSIAEEMERMFRQGMDNAATQAQQSFNEARRQNDRRRQRRESFKLYTREQLIDQIIKAEDELEENY